MDFNVRMKVTVWWQSRRHHHHGH